MLETARPPARAHRVGFSIVGVGGASAGGLRSMVTQLLRRVLPADTAHGRSVLIQHLDPTHPEPARARRSRGRLRCPCARPEQGMARRANRCARTRDRAEHLTSTIGTRAGRCVSPRRSEGALSAPAGGLRSCDVAGRGARQPRDRRDALGLRIGRHGGPARDQGARTASRSRRIRARRSSRHASERDRRRRRRLLPDDRSSSRDELARLSRHPYVQPREASSPRSDASAARPRSSRACAATVGVDFGEFKPSTVERAASPARLALRRVVDLRCLPGAARARAGRRSARSTRTC